MKLSGIVMLAALLLSGCGMMGDKDPTPVAVTVTAAADVNPDASHRPSPIVVRIYQLKSGAAFDQADYFKLAEGAPAVLGDTLIGSEQVQLTPGKTQTLTIKLDPAARQIGVAAGFRDIDHARWHASTPVGPDTSAVTIAVGAADVSVKAGD